jgi:endonuclease YncB( thermonuclease family)
VRWGVLPVVGALILLVILDRRGLLLVPRSSDLHDYHGRQARVVRVIDGDTIDVDLPDHSAGTPTTRVRLWGIDCPERATNEHRPEPLADDATALTAALVESRVLTLQLESHRPRDTWRRVLAHADLEDRSCLNESLLAAGLARVDERWSHERLDRYAAAQRAARQRRQGLWSEEPLASR